MGFFDNVKKAFGFEKKDDVESHNNENINNKDKPAENKGKKEIQHVHSEESVLKDRKIDQQTAIRNFRYLDELIHSGVKEIVLDSDIVLDPDEKSQYLNGIKLDADDLAIDGNGHAIDARGLTRIFFCTGKNIIIKNIILKNGFTKENGGAIHNNGELTITESTLNNNTAQWDGGAIHNWGGLTITESTLTENTAEGDGGAIHNYGELSITESTLTENTAKNGDGGAIKNSGELTITESTLNNNTAQRHGGAIKNSGELTITESTLNNNTAKDDGGAIYSNKEINISNCTLVNNLQSSFSFVENNNGLDIAWNDDFISSDEVTIYLDNKCDGEYPIVDNLIEWNKTLSKGPHEIIFELKDNNKIIMNFTYSPDIITTNVNNYAELINSINKAKYILTPQYIINLNKGDYNATKNILWKSFSNSNLIINGNGITLNGQNKCHFIKIGTNSKLTLNNIILTNFTSERSGGAITNSGELTITESTLTGNTAQWDGGAIHNWGGLTITESTLTENTAKDDGGAIKNSGELTITESTLTENTAKDDGGAIHNGGGELTITESTLQQNTAKDDGGAIHNNGELTITESTLQQNTAKDDGGAIHNEGGELTITESTLQQNTAKDDGGAIHNEGGELTITESTLNNNTAQRHGGAIHNYKGNFKIFNCEFLNNKSPDNIILNKDSLQIYNTIFRNNQSRVVVLNDGNGANLGIFYGEFRENNVGQSVLCNSGKFCGVEKTVFQDNISNDTLNIINNSELTLTNPNINEGKSILNQNYILIKKSSPELEKKIYGEGTVENIGEGIPQGENFDFGYLDKKIHESNNLEVILDYDITFENYESDFYEGGIYLDIDDLIIDGNGHTIDGADQSRIFIITGKNITLKNIIFKNGHSHKNYDNPLNQHGGAIKINYNSKITIKNCEFINNTSEEDGGAIHNNEGELTITESTLNNNTAQRHGGAINNWKGELTITESTLNNNTARYEYGGAIFNNGGELTITKSTLNNNTAQGKYGAGGAIHNYEGELTITESTLQQNTAEGYGGAIHNTEGGELTITESTLTENTAQRDGGAISNWEGELTITESTLTENTAQENGGAIHNLDEKSFKIKDCKLDNNIPNNY